MWPKQSVRAEFRMAHADKTILTNLAVFNKYLNNFIHQRKLKTTKTFKLVKVVAHWSLLPLRIIRIILEPENTRILCLLRPMFWFFCPRARALALFNIWFMIFDIYISHIKNFERADIFLRKVLIKQQKIWPF